MSDGNTPPSSGRAHRSVSQTVAPPSRPFGPTQPGQARRTSSAQGGVGEAGSRLSEPPASLRGAELPAYDFEGEPPVESRPSVSLGPLGLLGFGPEQPAPPSAFVAPSRSPLLTLASLVIVIAALKIARPLLVPLAVSAFLATLTAPGVLYLKRRRVPAELGVPIVVLLTILLVGALAGIVAGSLNAFIQALPAYQAQMGVLLVSMTSQLEQLGVEVSFEDVYSLVQPAAALGFLGDTLSGIADLLSDTVLVLLLTVFLLFEAMVLPAKIRAALGDPRADLSRGIRVVNRIKAYVVVKTWTSLATGLIIGVSLHLLGIDFALLWGLVAFLLNFIPNIGSIIAAIPAIIMATLQLGVAGATITTVIFLVVNTVIGSFLEPRIMGQRMNLSPLVVVLSLVFWGWLWGGLGMLLSVPLTMAIRIMLEGNPSTKSLAILMAGARSSAEIAAGEAPPPSSFGMRSRAKSRS